MKKIFAIILTFAVTLSVIPQLTTKVYAATEVSTILELQSALNLGGEIVLTNNIWNTNFDLFVNFRTTIDLNGNELYTSRPCGIYVSDRLTIKDSQYTDENPGTGKLTAIGTYNHTNNSGAGIRLKSYGSLVIESGVIEATGNLGGAGIGCARNDSDHASDSVWNGYLEINGGIVTATSRSAAGIGGANIGGYSEYTNAADGRVIINGGTVNAVGGRHSAGIGGGLGSVGGNITINGGTVNAVGGVGAAGIGGGFLGGGGNITINGGVIHATGNAEEPSNEQGENSAPGIGAGEAIGSFYGSFEKTKAVTHVTINGGIITATGYGRKGIGIGENVDPDRKNKVFTFTMRGNSVVFTNGISDPNENTRTGGILFTDDNEGAFYGTDFTLTENAAFPPAGKTLEIPNGSTLTVPVGVTLHNNGAIKPAASSTIHIYGTVTGNKINGADIGELSAISNTGNSVTINAFLTADTGQETEYACNTENVKPTSGWQSNRIFDNLIQNTPYFFFARSKENDNFDVGTASVIAVTTNSDNPSLPPLQINSIIPEDNMITVEISNPVYGAVLITAVYDKNRNLLNFKTEIVTPEKLSGGKIILENISIPAITGTIVKAMIWDSISSVQPLCNPKTVSISTVIWN